MVFNPATAEHSKTLPPINHSLIDETLVDFPVAIDLARFGGSIFTDCRADRKKIAVTLADGTTQCKIEIEHWDHVHQKGVLHVKIPSISAISSTIIKLFWDSGQDDNTDYVGDTGDTPAQEVWDDDFVAVYLLAQDPSGGSGCILDSTSNLNNGTPVSMTSDDLVDGLLGKALAFNGVDQRISIPDTSELSGGHSITIEALFKSLKTSEQGVVTKYKDNDNKDWSLYSVSNNVKFQSEAGKNHSNFLTLLDGTLDTWKVAAFAFTHSTKELKGFLGGVKNVTNCNYYLPNTTGSVQIGYTAYYNFYLQGSVGQVRISKIARSDAWMKASNASLKDILFGYNFATPLTGLQPRISGTGTITATLEVADIKVRRRVTLLDHKTMRPVAQTWSDALTGVYTFTGLDPFRRYLVIGDDYNQIYNAAVADWVVPTV